MTYLLVFLVSGGRPGEGRRREDDGDRDPNRSQQSDDAIDDDVTHASGHVEALGLHRPSRHAELAQGVLDRIHHGRRAADEELEAAVLPWQMPAQHVEGDVAPLAWPLGFRGLEDVDDL